MTYVSLSFDWGTSKIHKVRHKHINSPGDTHRCYCDYKIICISVCLYRSIAYSAVHEQQIYSKVVHTSVVGLLCYHATNILHKIVFLNQTD